MSKANYEAVMRSTQATAVPFTPRGFDPRRSLPLHRQLYDALRAAILDGRLPAGARLPATRVLAVDLGLSRTTVLTAMAQLLAEGYVEGKTGSGTYVARVLPDAPFLVASPLAGDRAAVGEGAPAPAPDRTLSHRGRLLMAAPSAPPRDAGAPRAFRTGVPALDVFPWKAWLRIEARCLRRLSGALRLYDNPAGYRPLRQAIADYLGAARAVRCDPDQVIVVAGSQQALDLVARLLLDPGDAVWVEDPGYGGAKGALAAAGARLVPVPVGAEGLDVAAGMRRHASARLAYVTPSHQYPLGVTMSLTRRLALLRWASDVAAWVLEDDYDSEYRYAGRPLAALQGLDTAGRVIYMGAFSKVLFPALRLGYLVAPPDLADAFARAKALTDRGSPVLGQAVVADFLAEGHVGRHIRRMRALYSERQGALTHAARERLAGAIDVPAQECGMSVMGWLPAGTDDRRVSLVAARHGVEATALSTFGLEPCHAPGLVLGYAHLDAPRIRAGVDRLATTLEDVL